MGNGKIGTKILTNLANKNPDLKDVYMAKIEKNIKKHMEKSLEEYVVDSNVVLAELNKRLESSQFLVGDQYTIADTMVAIWM